MQSVEYDFAVHPPFKKHGERDLQNIAVFINSFRFSDPKCSCQIMI